MNILVVGGTGLIGSAVVGRLAALCHSVIAASRSKGNQATHVSIDLAKAKETDWRPLLNGVDAVINCAGVLQDGPGSSTAKVHHTGIDAGREPHRRAAGRCLPTMPRAAGLALRADVPPGRPA